MGTEWISTNFPGIRYRKHGTRKHGVKYDRYFAIRYQAKKERVEEGLGWSSEGWTEQKAALTLAQLKKAARTGQGPDRLSKQRKAAAEAAEAKAAAEAQAANESLTFKDIFTEQYFPIANGDKSPKSCDRENHLFSKWIRPTIGDLPLKHISPIHLERLKKTMRDSELSDRSIQYALALVRQVFNFAYRHNLFNGENPAHKINIPRPNNRRTRFLSPDEAAQLLEALKKKSLELHEIALLSLHCGLRAGEVFALQWIDIDLKNRVIVIKDAKGGKSRYAHMTHQVLEIFRNKTPGAASDLVFPPAWGRGYVRDQISAAFNRTVNELGFNDGVNDRRDKIVFHSLRHTYASWLVQSGVSLYEVKDRLGHSTLGMTERYSHLAPDSARATVGAIEMKIQEVENKKKAIK